MYDYFYFVKLKWRESDKQWITTNEKQATRNYKRYLRRIGK